MGKKIVMVAGGVVIALAFFGASLFALALIRYIALSIAAPAAGGGM
jgi:hypothetical protein